MKSVVTVLACCLLLIGGVHAQHITFAPSVGTPQVVPDPLAGAPGIANLSGAYCELPVKKLFFELHCLPGNWAHGQVTSEICYFVLDVGNSGPPGFFLLGGQFYVPAIIPAVIARGPVLYLGPGDIICAGPNSRFASSSATCIPNYTRMGARLDLSSSISPGLIGSTFTIQGFMLDFAISRAYTSNALNFTFVP